jgi:hypothetical protein
MAALLEALGLVQPGEEQAEQFAELSLPIRRQAEPG